MIRMWKLVLANASRGSPASKRRDRLSCGFRNRHTSGNRSRDGSRSPGSTALRGRRSCQILSCLFGFHTCEIDPIKVRTVAELGMSPGGMPPFGGVCSWETVGALLQGPHPC